MPVGGRQREGILQLSTGNWGLPLLLREGEEHTPVGEVRGEGGKGGEREGRREKYSTVS